MAYHHNEATEAILDGVMKLPSIPSFGAILFPGKPSLQFIWEMFFDDEAEVAEILEELLSHRYLSLRTTPTTHDDYDLAKLFDMRDNDFKQAVRTTKDGFLWLLDRIRHHPIFYSNSPRPQLPIPHQLALTLERLGSNGNGASVGRFSRNLSVGRGTVIKVSRRVIQAINEVSTNYIVWPNKERRAEISEVMTEEGFEGCIGFVDGTTIPLHQRPGLDGEVYWDRKKQYSINCQVICDCDRFITSFMTGWPGTCGDSLVFKNMKVHLEPDRFFDPGQYLIADSAYALSMTTIPAYKSPLSKINRNTEFNYCLAKSRVRNEHTIGILKGRWASLQQLRLSLYTPQHMVEIIRWINCCVALHNMLAHLGDSWDELATPNDNDEPGDSEGNHENNTEGHREEIQEKCLLFNHLVGTLPIPSH
ncbi:uncharacterized protein PGTG_08407 [Puccinia graminis f. sp. tritici CRL 75-36-700-3]|uniref:Putative nuclease HARBI1 n=1 Tax=Puccinia graminis f. sp. tritici (strain CRL 75-36-700-3 / race SCCL) TaxID=418459 RepID=E3KDL5_PUCGT|nr:uncharacterized protein PGTG_08407 [Puccinia graminis f. sp. tritici CRL 75-36-700-3]EFP82451.2 hypothetical protein PGTG_08407 [Puccinia graminis f. sp. tritici CRL 75-36-700-3]